MKKIASVISLAVSCILTLVTVGGAAGIGLRGIGGKVAIVMPEGEVDNTFGLGAVADLGDIIPQLNLEASADYWGDSWDIPGYEFSWSVITIGGTVKYHFSMGEDFSPFAGGGLGLAIGRAKSEYKVGTWLGQPIGDVDYSETDTELGFHAVGGVDMPIGSNMKLTLEIKYATSDYDAIWLGGAILVRLY